MRYIKLPVALKRLVCRHAWRAYRCEPHNPLGFACISGEQRVDVCEICGKRTKPYFVKYD